MKYNYKLEDYVQNYDYTSYIDFVVNELSPIVENLRFSEFVTVLDDFDKLIIISTLMKALNKHIKINITKSNDNVQSLLTISYDYEICLETLSNDEGRTKEITCDLIIVNQSNVKNEFYNRSLCNNERILLYDIEKE